MILAPTLQNIREGQTHRIYVEKHLPGANLRIGDATEHQPVDRFAQLMDLPSLHACDPIGLTGSRE